MQRGGLRLLLRSWGRAQPDGHRSDRAGTEAVRGQFGAPFRGHVLLGLFHVAVLGLYIDGLLRRRRGGLGHLELPRDWAGGHDQHGHGKPFRDASHGSVAFGLGACHRRRCRERVHPDLLPVELVEPARPEAPRHKHKPRQVYIAGRVAVERDRTVELGEHPHEGGLVGRAVLHFAGRRLQSHLCLPVVALSPARASTLWYRLRLGFRHRQRHVFDAPGAGHPCVRLHRHRHR
mmetsp:Transcript_5662/g.15973  ORF Transcript_5662/g.15973 Transcript_5662/m.15973 type:complete len:233 (-) Transcript_5662:1043-1741(-)